MHSSHQYAKELAQKIRFSSFITVDKAELKLIGATVISGIITKYLVLSHVHKLALGQGCGSPCFSSFCLKDEKLFILESNLEFI